MGPDELCAHTAQRLQRIERGAKRADQARQSIALRDAKTDVLSVELAQARRICFGVKRKRLRPLATNSGARACSPQFARRTCASIWRTDWCLNFSGVTKY